MSLAGVHLASPFGGAGAMREAFAFEETATNQWMSLDSARERKGLMKASWYNIVLVPSLVLLAMDCSRSPIGPGPFTNPREYKWVVDTIAYPGSFQTNMRGIWGTSYQNLYVVGHNDQNSGFTFHFDGKSWREVPMTVNHGGFINGAMDLTAIYGFGSSNAWVVGERLYNNPDPNSALLDSSLIVQFDGVQWREHRISGGRTLQAIWGNSSQDIWASGLNTLLHYDGNLWNRQHIFLPDTTIYLFSIAGLSSQDVFLMGNRFDARNGVDTYFLYHFDGTNWSLIDSSKTGNEKYGTVLQNVSGTVYSIDYGLWKWVGSEWQQIRPSALPWIGIGGTGTDNLLISGIRSQLIHFNGTDWYQFSQFSNNSLDFTGVWTDGYSAFVVGNDGNKTFVARGK